MDNCAYKGHWMMFPIRVLCSLEKLVIERVETLGPWANSRDH